MAKQAAQLRKSSSSSSSSKKVEEDVEVLELDDAEEELELSARTPRRR
jgi:hypothetical protein